MVRKNRARSSSRLLKFAGLRCPGTPSSKPELSGARPSIKKFRSMHLLLSKHRDGLTKRAHRMVSEHPWKILLSLLPELLVKPPHKEPKANVERPSQNCRNARSFGKNCRKTRKTRGNKTRQVFEFIQGLEPHISTKCSQNSSLYLACTLVYPIKIFKICTYIDTHLK